jgi:gas vesicle protein
MMDTNEMKSKLQHAYETMLSHVEEFLKSEKTTLSDALQQAQTRLHDLGDLSRDEIDGISSEFVKNLKDVGEEAHEIREGLGNALKMDAMYISSGIMDRLKMVADQTSVELMQLNEELAERIREREQEQQQSGSVDKEEQHDV